MPEELDEDRVQYVAKALYDSAVQNTIEAVEKKTLDHQRMRSIARKVQKESDRSCAIILYSLADEILQDLIIQECNQDIPDLRRRMFGQFDMLPNPSSRMFFAFALRWMTRVTFHNLNIVKRCETSSPMTSIAIRYMQWDTGAYHISIAYTQK